MEMYNGTYCWSFLTIVCSRMLDHQNRSATVAVASAVTETTTTTTTTRAATSATTYLHVG